MLSNIVYTQDQVAQLLQVSANTVYKLIEDGEIVAKKLGGRVYRVPQSSIAFVFGGLDIDLLAAQKVDEINLPKVQKLIKNARSLR